jgi:DNA-binding FadR family transcriptional regulator
MRSNQFEVSNGRVDTAAVQPSGRRFVVVAQRLLSSIHSGELPAGSQLPPDRVLAVDFSVSRGTMREALLALELLGVVDIRHGAGVFVVDSTVAAGLSGGHDWFNPSTTALFEARAAIEPKVARLCSLRMTDEQISEMSAEVARARQAVEAGAEYSVFAELQMSFHQLLIQGSGSPVLADINRHLMSVEEHPLWALLNQQALRTSTERMGQVLEHAEILDCIAGRQPEAAGAAMLQHVTNLGCALVGTSWIP